MRHCVQWARGDVAVMSLLAGGDSPNYRDAIMTAITSQITFVSIVYSPFVYVQTTEYTKGSSYLFFCEENSLASNAGNIFIWWPYHAVFRQM